MKGKLIKDHDEYMLINDERFVIATTDESMLEVKDKMKLSKQNCDEIFGVVDVVYKQVRNGFDGVIDSFTEAFAKECINKAMELNKDKLFTKEDGRKAYFDGYNDKEENKFFNPSKSLQQPTEIEVEVTKSDDIKSVEKDWYKIGEPKLDEKKCLILKKI